MARFNIGRIAYDYRARHREEFCRLLARQTSLEGIRDFCWDLFSTKELVMFMRRIAVAQLLMTGMSQIEITRKMGFSRSLVSSVHDRMMRNGKGFKEADTHMMAIDAELDLATKRESESADSAKAEYYIQHYTRAFASEHLVRGIEDQAPYVLSAVKRKMDRRSR